jgi:hypothetical protein
MRIINNKTMLKQGKRIFTPTEIDGIIYWKSNRGFVAQSKLRLEDLPVINLDDYYKKIKSIKFNNEKDLVNFSNENDINIISISNSGNFSGGFVLFYTNNSFKGINYQDVIDRTIKLSRDGKIETNKKGITKISYNITRKEILENINLISVIEVDENFNILNVN